MKQCTRRPLKTILFFVLLTLGSFLLCLGVRFYQYSAQCRTRLEGNFTTIAVPNINRINEEIPRGGSIIGLYEQVLSGGEETGIGELDQREGYMGYSETWRTVMQYGSGCYDMDNYCKWVAAVVTCKGEKIESNSILSERTYIYQVEEMVGWEERFAVPEVIYARIPDGYPTGEPGQRCLIVGRVWERLTPEDPKASEFQYQIEIPVLGEFYKNRVSGTFGMTPLVVLKGGLEEPDNHKRSEKEPEFLKRPPTGILGNRVWNQFPGGIPCCQKPPQGNRGNPKSGSGQIAGISDSCVFILYLAGTAGPAIRLMGDRKLAILTKKE